jgi:hypothetical protein
MGQRGGGGRLIHRTVEAGLWRRSALIPSPFSLPPLLPSSPSLFLPSPILPSSLPLLSHPTFLPSSPPPSHHYHPKNIRSGPAPPKAAPGLPSAAPAIAHQTRALLLSLSSTLLLLSSVACSPAPLSRTTGVGRAAGGGACAPVAEARPWRGVRCLDCTSARMPPFAHALVWLLVAAIAGGQPPWHPSCGHRTRHVLWPGPLVVSRVVGRLTSSCLTVVCRLTRADSPNGLTQRSHGTWSAVPRGRWPHEWSRLEAWGRAAGGGAGGRGRVRLGRLPGEAGP